MTEPDKKTESQVPDAQLFPWWLLLLWGVLTILIGLMFLLTPVITTVLSSPSWERTGSWADCLCWEASWWTGRIGV